MLFFIQGGVVVLYKESLAQKVIQEKGIKINSNLETSENLKYSKVQSLK